MSETEKPKPTRRQHITREEEADRCLNHTVYSKGAQFVTLLCFLLIVFGVPAAQHYVEIKRNLAARAAWSPSSGQPEPGIAPQIYDVFGLLPTGAQLKQAHGFWGYWNLIPSVESISAFESSLKENSVLTTTFLSPTQLVMSKYLGAGNEKAYVGKDGWLFYRPDVEYLTTPGFLDPSRLKDRSRGATAIQPDPVKAILDFKTQLAARGIQLVVMPMPTKPMIYPEMLAGPSADGISLQNDSFASFKQDLESNGVDVFDATPILLTEKSRVGNQKLYLNSDTHWTPPAMMLTAVSLSDFIKENAGITGQPEPYNLIAAPVTNLGDIAEMLKLPPDQTLFARQTVTTQRVVDKDGSPWKPDRAGQVLLLGDSFSNIYSLDGMGWGSSAGFAEHLSYALGQGIDKIVINAGGSFASRRELARQLATGVDRLANKKVVVYEFSMRDLAQGDWKMIHLATPPPPPSQPTPNPVVAPPTATPATAYSAIVIDPAAFDPTKTPRTSISVTMPPGNSTVSVTDANGKSVQFLGSSSGTVESHPEFHWNGKDANGKPVAPGSYFVRVEGTRHDGTAFAPALQSVVVLNAAQKNLVALGADPPKFDPTLGKGTTVSYQVPVAGTYTGTVDDLQRRRVVLKLRAVKVVAPCVIKLHWDGNVSAGHPAPDGFYTVTLHGPTPVGTAMMQVTAETSKKTPVTPAKTKPPVTKPVESEMVVSGRIAARATPPKPGSVPYKDCIIALQLTDLKVTGGTVKGQNIVVYVWGMRDNKLTDGAYTVGQTLRFNLVPWASMDSKYGGYNRQELDSDDALSWDAFWGEIK